MLFKRKEKNKMLSKLRWKYFATIMLTITIVLLSLFWFAKSGLERAIDNDFKYISNYLVKTDGLNMPNFEESADLFPFLEALGDFILNARQPIDFGKLRNAFSVKIAPDGLLLGTVSRFPINYSFEEIVYIANQAFIANEEYGNIDGLRYQVAEKPYGYLIVFMDRRMMDVILYRVDTVFFFIYIFSMLLSGIVALVLSNWALKPIKTAFIKQRQFVADTSHELKTPLAVINTNLDVLEDEMGNNKWFQYIKGEAHRMSLLVKDLLYLAKYDSSEMIYDFIHFDISRSLTQTILPFESIAFEKGLTFEEDIEPSIMYKGDENRIKQLAIIFIDNALKHCEEKGTIRVSLKQQGNKKIFSVYNTGEGLENKQMKKIFERFYRADKSRTRDTGGSGLGLAIATTIAHAHKAKITVNGVKGEWIEFSLIL